MILSFSTTFYLIFSFDFGTSFDFIGGTAPTLTTAASSVDRLDYIVLDSSNIHTVATLAYS